MIRLGKHVANILGVKVRSNKILEQLQTPKLLVITHKLGKVADLHHEQRFGLKVPKRVSK